MTAAASAVYVYGLAADSAIPSLAGVDGAPVRALTHDGLVALVSSIDRSDLRAADLRAHWRVLDSAFEHTTVLPVRFGTLMANEGEVRDRLLAANRERIAELLQEMNGLVQLNVKGRYDESALLQGILRSAPALVTLRDRANRSGALGDQVALGRRVEHEIDGRRAGDTATATRLLQRCAVAVRDEQVGHPEAFNLACLVARDNIDAVGETVSELRTLLGEAVEIRYVGPAPPFSFADSPLGAGEHAWA